MSTGSNTPFVFHTQFMSQKVYNVFYHLNSGALKQTKLVTAIQIVPSVYSTRIEMSCTLVPQDNTRKQYLILLVPTYQPLTPLLLVTVLSKFSPLLSNELTGRNVLGRDRGETRLALDIYKVEYIRKSVKRLYAFSDSDMENKSGKKWRRA